MRFKHDLPRSHTASDALVLKLHSQVGGIVAVLQVSALSRQLDESRQEHAGCPSATVIFRHDLPGPQGA